MSSPTPQPAPYSEDEVSGRWWIAVAAVGILGTIVLIWFALSTTGVITIGQDSQGDSTDAPAIADIEARPACPTGADTIAAGAASPNSPLVGVKVPCLGTDQEPIDLAEALAGQPAIITFWAWNCVACREELPVLEEWSRANPDITVVGVQQSTSPARGAALLRDLGVGLPSYQDSADVTGPALGLPRVLPVTVIINADATVAAILPSAFTSTADVDAAVAEALG
ncbi:TlpA family protein disulfide reductase [Corynebacterium sp. TAE3-ERU12]|uniref:TlpA family protein disulfide reductase n=1 Tax=Corynebacterium sp. TAE3-ERU12 TaxID=2849491 RepID=UPI001C44CC78|nr:TlpA disulfide reductase family protein [Corynebacterium sp. TAE3-ERU12]MBV7294479.1 TlpA family protein disulfide reductase [Corynebacterium sp. TAE3-ERU12]